MSMEKFVEVSCDYCGNGSHASGGSLSDAKRQLRMLGLIFSKQGDFCDKECFDNFKRDLNHGK